MYETYLWALLKEVLVKRFILVLIPALKLQFSLTIAYCLSLEGFINSRDMTESVISAFWFHGYTFLLLKNLFMVRAVCMWQ